MNNENEKTKIAIVGASVDRTKYGNRALRGFLAAGYDVYPINPSLETVEGVKCYPTLSSIPIKPDIVSVYTSPSITEKLVAQIAEVHAEEVYFNPGSENENVKRLAKDLKVNAIFACSVIAHAFFVD